MQLIYRGTILNYNPANVNVRQSVQRRESTYELIYRGNTYRVDPTASKPASTKSNEYELIYRGSMYRVNRNEQGEVTAITSTNFSKCRTSVTHPAIQNIAS